MTLHSPCRMMKNDVPMSPWEMMSSPSGMWRSELQLAMMFSRCGEKPARKGRRSVDKLVAVRCLTRSSMSRCTSGGMCDKKFWKLACRCGPNTHIHSQGTSHSHTHTHTHTHSPCLHTLEPTFLSSKRVQLACATTVAVRGISATSAISPKNEPTPSCAVMGFGVAFFSMLLPRRRREDDRADRRDLRDSGFASRRPAWANSSASEMSFAALMPSLMHLIHSSRCAGESALTWSVLPVVINSSPLIFFVQYCSRRATPQ